MEPRRVGYLVGRRGSGLLALVAAYEAALAPDRLKEPVRMEGPIKEEQLPPPQLSRLEEALREEKVRSRKHYAVSGTYAEVHRSGKVVVVKRRTINAPVGKYDDAPRGGGAKERARRAAAMAKAQETGANDGNAAGAGEQQG